MTTYEARCGYCDETHVFATADQRSQWLDYHWADYGHDPDGAFTLDRSEPSTADDTHSHPDPTPRGRTRRNQDSSDRLSAYVRGRLCRCDTGEHCPVHSSADHKGAT